MELLAKLGINWSLLLAQVVNFTILLGVLSFFVYTPLLNLLDSRRERIRKAMEDAAKIESQKKEIEQYRSEQMRKIDQECGAFLEKAKTQAEHMKGEILEAAKREADHTLERGRRQLEAERAKVFGEVQHVVTSAILRITEKILEREFSAEDQHRLLTSLEKELPSLLL
ncbi:ATP synthase F0 subunit B [Candidatus Peribacteria bacterium RIFCSPHIGHO2_01_FULL_51_9]|nr:MAG: ATP synthase F0 subunit B [Candidatus Peribacteria bacterium RIFCSPHIGHO2_01_FULL_51_9]